MKPRPLKVLSRHIIAFLAGTGFCLASLEVSLHIIGNRRAPMPEASPGGFRVLCVGGSHTEGIGVDPSDTYCSQLEARLTKAGLPDVRTYNLGRAGWNSHQVAQMLPEAIAKYQPQLVIGMVGEPNSWTLNGFDEYVSEYEEASWWRRLKAKLSNLRIVRLYGLVTEEPKPVQDVDSKTRLLILAGAAEYGTHPRKIFALEKIFHDAAGRGPRAVTAAVSLAEYARIRGRPTEEILKWLKRADAASDGVYNRSLAAAVDSFSSDKLNPQTRNEVQELSRKIKAQLNKENLPALALEILLSPGRFAKLDQCATSAACLEVLPRLTELDRESGDLPQKVIALLTHLARYELVADILSSWIRWNPVAANEAPVGLAAATLREIAPAPQTDAIKVRLQQALASSIKEFPWLRTRFEKTLDDQIMARWIAHDLKKIANQLREKNIKFLLQTLPPQRKPGLPRRKIDPFLLSAAEQNGIPISDTWEAFGPFREKKLSDDQSEIFSNVVGSTDMHLNAEGHRVVTERIFADLYRQKIL